MTYYLASLLFGEDGTITATYRVPSSPLRLGLRHQRTLNTLIPSLPMTLEPTSPGGATPSSTQEEAEAGPPVGGPE